MESIGRRTTATSTNVTSAVVGLLLSPSRPSVTTITSNSKITGLCHVTNPRVPLQHSSNGNVINHEQYAPIFQEHSGQLITSPTVPAVSTSPIIMPTSNITSVGMELSPFGILPHERVVPQHTHHRQHRKFPVCPQFSKTPMDTDFEPRTTSQSVGYLSVITRTTNSVTMDNMATNNNYYQTQPLPLPLQTKTSDNHDRQYYHFENTVSPNQTTQHQLDNILLMGAPVQRGDPMHIVKNLQSMQTDIDCYGVKKMIEQQPRIISTDIGKSVGSPTLLNNISGKRIIENQQLPKSVMINPSYNGQYFNRRQPPPAHLYPHHGQTNIQQNIMIGNTYLDVHRHPNWNLDHQKPHTVSTTSCFTANVSSGVFHQSILQQSQPYNNNTVSTFNVQPSVSNIPQLQQMPVPTHNNFIVSTVNPTYYAQTPSTVSPMTSVTTSSPSIFNRQHHNNEPQNTDFQDFTNNIQSTNNYVVNDDNRPPYTPHVVVPNIEEELSHLCDETMSSTNAIIKPLNVKQKQPSFIDSYIKFLNGGAGSISKSEIENNEKSKKLLHPLSTSTPKPLPKPYIPISKPKIVTANEQTLSCSNGEDIKKTTSVTTLDEDPRYFPLPKTSSSILDEKSEGSNHENSWSGDQDQDQWWITSSLEIKKKINVNNKKKKKNNTQKKKPLNSNAVVKKQKTQHLQPPKRQLSHRLAKEKTRKLLSSINGELDIEDDSLSETDSDVDPAWIPNTEDNDASKNCASISGRRNVNNNKHSKDQNSISENLPTTSSLTNNNNDKFDDSTAMVPFKSGTFVALQNQFLDNEQIQGDIPQHLWRVDGKSLLQKFQRCDNSDMFKSVSTYTGWGPPHYNMYRQVSVQFITKDNNATFIPNKSSTDVFVKLLCDNSNKFIQYNSKVCSTDNQISKPKVDTSKSISSMNTNDQNKLLRANFDVYVQTLTSQALDSNFLGEIYRENDEFFLSNVRAIEKVTQTWLETMDALIRESAKKLPKVNNLRTVVTRYPELEICSMGEISVNNIPLQCIVCGYEESIEKYQKFDEISLSGTEYSSRTLKTLSAIQSVQKLHCCSIQCSDMLIILHSLEHLKYKIYKECCKRINAENDDNCTQFTNKDTQDTTTILNRLLADDEWIEKLFRMMSNTWSRAKRFVSNNQSNYRVSS